MKRFSWAIWPRAGTPCQFSNERAQENAALLERWLGEDWIAEGIAKSPVHPALIAWKYPGDQGFLALNALAEDLRLLEAVPGFHSMLHDLRQVAGYLPTRHMIRAAALMARGGTRVVELFAPSNESVPDFEIEIAGQLLPVEAKQLTSSEPERNFGIWAKTLHGRLLEKIMTGSQNYPEVRIISKGSDRLVDADEIISAVRRALDLHRGSTSELRGKQFNIFVLDNPQSANFTEYSNIQVLAPRSAKESLRIARRAEKSNKQLRNHTQDRLPGLLCLGLTQHQDPRLVIEVLQRKFRGRQLRGISGVILLTAFENPNGPQGGVTVDLIHAIPNLNALIAPPENIPVRSLGPGGDMIKLQAQTDSVSCYAFGMARGRIVDANAGGWIGMDPTVLLTKKMLA